MPNKEQDQRMKEFARGDFELPVIRMKCKLSKWRHERVQFDIEVSASWEWNADMNESICRPQQALFTWNTKRNIRLCIRNKPAFNKFSKIEG